MKKRRYFALLELLLALFLTSFFVASIAMCWRSIQVNRRLERQTARALARSRFQRSLNEYLDAVLVPHRKREDISSFRAEKKELFFTYRPAFEQIERLGPIATGHLKLDSHNNLRLISQSIFPFQGLCDTEKTLLLVQGVEQLAFSFIPAKGDDGDFDRPKSHWSDEHHLPHMMKIALTFSDGEIWEIPHIFQNSLWHKEQA